MIKKSDFASCNRREKNTLPSAGAVLRSGKVWKSSGNHGLAWSGCAVSSQRRGSMRLCPPGTRKVVVQRVTTPVGGSPYLPGGKVGWRSE
jgi:hypothetical protein